MDMVIDKNARKIDLSNRGLTEIPSEVFSCKRLRKLNLRGNKITKIPKEIERLKGVVLLDLTDNKIKEIHAPICKLKNLRILILNRNQIRRLPVQINSLNKLKILGLGNNKLTNLPVEIADLENLEELNLSFNQLQQFPVQLRNFKNKLKKLWISGYVVDFQNGDEVNLISHLSHNFSVYCGDLKVVHDITKIDDIMEPVIRRVEEIRDSAIPLNNRRMDDQEKSKVNSQVTTDDKPTVFISYSHADKVWFDRLMVHLSALESLTGSKIKVWSDRELKGGDNIPEEIAKALDKASVAVLMFSPDFLNSDFIKRKEIPPILRKAKENGTMMKPILVKPCLYRHLPDFKDILAMNDLNEPLSKMTSDQNDEVFNKLNEEIIELLELKLRSLK